MVYRYRTIKVNGKTKLQHRHLVELRLGRRLRPDEDVHHRNDDRYDNRASNLDVLPNTEHRALHADRRLKHPREKACRVCGGLFTPHRTKRKRQITCSVVCANVQRSRSEKATKSCPPVAAALVRANYQIRDVAPEAPGDFTLQAAE